MNIPHFLWLSSFSLNNKTNYFSKKSHIKIGKRTRNLSVPHDTMFLGMPFLTSLGKSLFIWNLIWKKGKDMYTCKNNTDIVWLTTAYRGICSNHCGILFSYAAYYLLAHVYFFIKEELLFIWIPIYKGTYHDNIK